MSLPVPLAVRLVTARQDLHVTRDLRDLTFRSVAPGGFASCTVALDRALSVQPDEVAYYGRLVVYDARNGNTVWDGRLEDPGRSAGAGGQVWDLAAVGPSAHASDRTVPYIVVDRDLRALLRADSVTPMGRDQVAEDPAAAAGSGGQALVLTFPHGMDVVANDRILMRYNRLVQAGQKLARVSYTRDEGVVDAGHQTRGFAATIGGGGGADMFSSVNWSTVAGAVSGVVNTNWTNGRNALDLQAFRSGGVGTIGDDVHWTSITNLAIRAMLYSKAGTELTTGYTLDAVLASEVVADLLGRLLTQFDGANASIATTTHAIDQLAYPDGVTARQVFDDLMLLEPAYYWAAWERNAAGKHRFEWAAWPTAVRYEADVDDGYQSTGSGDGLYDAVQVRWKDVNGEIRLTRRTQTVPVLAAAGLTREAFVDLGDEVGSSGNADRVGDQFLVQHAAPPNAGRLTVARPILDTVAGRMVQPWEIRPGNLIRVRGILPRLDALNATVRDGVTVFRVVATTYRASTASAELELDSYPLTVSQALAKLASRPIRRRR